MDLYFDEDDDKPCYTSKRERIDVSEWMKKKVMNPRVARFGVIDEALVSLDGKDRGTLLSYDKINKKDNTIVKGFIVAGLKQFYSSYQAMSDENKINYENILIGEAKTVTIGKDEYAHNYDFAKSWSKEELRASALCHFYMDVDIDKTINPGMEYEERFTELMGHFKQFYREHLLESDVPLVKIADACGVKKFSKHVLVKSCTGDMFESGAHVGAFYRRFYLHILNKYGAPSENPYFIYAADRHGKIYETKMFMADHAVYTRYRCFRLLYSTKIGQTRPLLPEGRREKSAAEMQFESFLNYLIQFTSLPEVGVISVKEDNGQTPVWSSINPLNVAEYADGVWRFNEGMKKKTYVAVTYTPRTKDVTFCEGVSVENIILKVGRAIAKNYADDDIRYCKPGKIGHCFSFQSLKQKTTPCPHSQSRAVHTGNHIVYHIVIYDKLMKLQLTSHMTCFSPKCSGLRTKSHPIKNLIPEDLYQELTAYAQRVVSGSVFNKEDFDLLF